MIFRHDRPDFGSRIIIAKIFVCLIFSLIWFRLWYLQGNLGTYYRDLSENNRTRTIRTASPRGMIFDREGRLLVRNRASFDVGLLVEDSPNPEQTVLALANLGERSPDEVVKQFKSTQKSRRFEPRPVLVDVSRARLARIKVNTHLLPGVMVSAVPTRLYPNGSLASQIFGYTREITKEQLARLGKGYRGGDQVGQSGLEKQYEDVLRGRAGYVQLEVDARGTRRGELGIVDEVVGGNLYLTLDLDLQREAEEALSGWRGAVVAMEPKSGEILALASSPTFDANLFSGHVSSKDWQGLLNHADKPLLNRAISSIYPPGSTMKLLWGLVGLQEKVITPTTTVFCPGHYKFGSRRYHCHKRGGHGYVNLKTAITLSCNVYFYQLGQSLGINRLGSYLKSWGFGQKTGIDIPGEEAGISPSREWKQRVVKAPWYPGDTLPVSIGQGYLSVTPLQMAVAISSLANDGHIVTPHLVKESYSPITEETQSLSKKAKHRIKINREYFSLMRQYAGSVVEHRRGTAHAIRLESLPIGGKTGTAQVRRGVGKVKDLRFNDHSWFVSFAPVQSPEIVVVALVENAGHGGSHAAPVARKVIKKFFAKRGVLSEEDMQSEISIPKPVVQ